MAVMRVLTDAIQRLEVAKTRLLRAKIRVDSAVGGPGYKSAIRDVHEAVTEYKQAEKELDAVRCGNG